MLKDREKELREGIALLETYMRFPTAHSPSEWTAMSQDAAITGLISNGKADDAKVGALLHELRNERMVRPLLLTPTLLFYLTSVPTRIMLILRGKFYWL